MEIKNPFLTPAEDIRLEREGRKRIKENSFGFGVRFLDLALGGISPGDLILLTAKTGIGKTSMAVQICMNALEIGKRVHFFSLESEVGEITRRLKFKLLVNEYYQIAKYNRTITPSYMDWVMGRQDEELFRFEAEIDEILVKKLKNFNVRYRVQDFSGDDFCREMQLVQDQTDLIVLDHLHFIDIEDVNENRGMKMIVKKIRDVSLLVGKPILLLAHVRKSDKKSQSLVPSIEDIHGSSDIGKVVTKAFSMAPDTKSVRAQNYLFPTYFRILKNRLDGSRTRYVALVNFNVHLDSYDDTFQVGQLNYSEDEFEEVLPFNLPNWLR